VNQGGIRSFETLGDRIGIETIPEHGLPTDKSSFAVYPLSSVVLLRYIVCIER